MSQSINTFEDTHFEYISTSFCCSTVSINHPILIGIINSRKACSWLVHHIVKTSFNAKFHPLTTNTSPENRWLEDAECSFSGWCPFQGCTWRENLWIPKILNASRCIMPRWSLIVKDEICLDSHSATPQEHRLPRRFGAVEIRFVRPFWKALSTIV